MSLKNRTVVNDTRQATDRIKSAIPDLIIDNLPDIPENTYKIVIEIAISENSSIRGLCHQFHGKSKG